MYSVLIVDDEEPVLESFSYLVESGLDEFAVGGTARSGGEAMAMARQHRPDVVLMDIAMPGIDGIDTIRELQHEFPDALYILSTAYERFDLAQRAIPLRVFAYLVKPVSRKRFMETMYRAKDELDEERERLNHRLEEAQYDEERLAREIESFMLLLTWKPLDENSWLWYQHLFHLSSDHGVVVAIEHPDRTLYPEIASRIERRYRSLWAENMGRMILLISDRAPPETIGRFLDGILKEVAPRSDLPEWGIGSRRRYDEFYLSCDEALSAVPNSLATKENLQRFRAGARAFGRTIARARSADDAGILYTAMADDVFAAWSFHVAKYRIAVVFERLLHDFESRVGDPEVSLMIADPVREIGELETRKEVDAWAHRVLRRLMEEQNRHAGAQWPSVLRQAVRFIDTHYAEPLQLTAVADHCEVSAGYLSRLFSEHLEVAFNDHLNTVRLDVAERLLEEGSRSIKEIAAEVGYQDPNYFSRIFKKFKGVSPTRFVRGEADGA